MLAWLVVSTPLKNMRQLGLLFPIYGKIKNVPNHQPVAYIPYMDPMAIEICLKNRFELFCPDIGPIGMRDFHITMLQGPYDSL